MAPDGVVGDAFGRTVAAAEDRIFVGSNNEAGAGAGAVYVFRHVAGSWDLEQKLAPEDLGPGAGFGR